MGERGNDFRSKTQAKRKREERVFEALSGQLNQIIHKECG